MSLNDHIIHIFNFACAASGNNRNRDSLRDLASEFKVKPLARPLIIDRSDDELTRA